MWHSTLITMTDKCHHMHLAMRTNKLRTDELAAGSRPCLRGRRRNPDVLPNGQAKAITHLDEMSPCSEGFDLSAVL
jgi:hypothetical protein